MQLHLPRYYTYLLISHTIFFFFASYYTCLTYEPFLSFTSLLYQMMSAQQVRGKENIFWPSHLPCVHAKSLQLCPTLCDSMDCNPPGSSVHGDSLSKNTSGLSFLSPGDLPNPGIEPVSLMSPALAGTFLRPKRAAREAWSTLIYFRYS